ncbi:MAG: type 4a pilus biogenesis protein PilO, partial [Candidatus Omnitrophota bacterium]|nr:type 4a pilus biogenesis protein PilO [Candidatus Omnitrophota bacterium]
LNLSKAEMEKAVLMGIGVFVFVIALLQFVTVPSLRKLGELNTETVKLRENLKKSQSLIANKSQMESRLAVLQQKLKDYKTALPPYSDMPNVLQSISNIASEAKVKIIKIEPLKVEQQQGAIAPGSAVVKPQAKPEAGKGGLLYTAVPIKIEAKGGYHALGKFINDIEASKNVMAIGDLEIETSSDDMFNHNARLLIIAYVLREETPAK